jgi:proline dehydrogenase
MLRAFFVRLSENPSLRNFAERSSSAAVSLAASSPAPKSPTRFAPRKPLIAPGMSVSIDNLGENVTNPEEARHSAQLYRQILDAIATNQLNANISLKLTHMGLDVDEPLAREIVSGLVAKAAAMNPPGVVRVDMEGSPYTQRTLDFVHELHRAPGNANSVGTVIQSYLKRSESDIEEAAGRRHSHSSVQRRLQGALRASPSKIRRCGCQLREADESPDEERHLSRPGYARRKHYSAGAGFRCAEKLPRDSFEFQMLYGIRRDLQQRLVRDGWRVRIYIPFGTEWYPYFMRRLGERPANVFLYRAQSAAGVMATNCSGTAQMPQGSLESLVSIATFFG